MLGTQPANRMSMVSPSSDEIQSEQDPRATSKCVLCGNALLPPPEGSEEHVFLSSLGGRLVTKRAICAMCNNAFATLETECADTVVSDFFEAPRNFLNIISGRRKPPPTIENLYDAVSGNHYDLAPGMVPVPRKLHLPSIDQMVKGTEHNLIARNEAEAVRAREILALRKIEIEKFVSYAACHQLGPLNYQMRLSNKNAAYRSFAKTAIVAGVVLYGNDVIREKVSTALCSTTRFGSGNIRTFVRAAVTSDWVFFLNARTRSGSPTPNPSGFEHSVVFADIGGHWQAFLQFFGGFRFCVDLGEPSGLPIRSIIVNPRSLVHASYDADIGLPEAALLAAVALEAQHDPDVVSQFSAALSRVLEVCYAEGMSRRAELRTEEFAHELEAAGDNEAAREEVMVRLSQKIATIDSGGVWREPIDLVD